MSCYEVSTYILNCTRHDALTTLFCGHDVVTTARSRRGHSRRVLYDAFCGHDAVTTGSRRGHDEITMQSRRVLWSRRGHDRITTGSRRGQVKPRAPKASCEHGFSDFIHESARNINKYDSKLKNGRAGQHLHKTTVMLEAFHIMLPGAYWLSKAKQALFPQISSNGLTASVHLSTSRSASVKLLLTSAGICHWSCTRCMPRLT